nr:MAG TPA: Integrase [Caudoviricetes sp.]
MAAFWYEDWIGKRKKKKREGFDTRSSALAFEREFLLKNSRSCDMSFASLVELYQEDAEHRVRGTTRGTQDSIIEKWLLPFFGSLQVDKIDAVTIRKWQNELMSKTNPRTGKKYAATYLRTINSRLSSIFNYAVMYYGLRQNPCRPAGFMGKKKAGRMKFWTTAEFEAALAQVEKPAFRVAFLLLYWLGLRVGECLALTPADILPSHICRVDKTHHRKNGEDEAGPPKSDNSVRDVSMPAFLYDEVENYIGALYEIQPSDRIFYFTHGTLNRELNRAAEAAGVQRIRIHDLRHSHAAMLVDLGYSIVAVAERLGDTVEVAMSTYSHLYPDKMDTLAVDLEQRAGGTGRQEVGLGDVADALEKAEKEAGKK